MLADQQISGEVRARIRFDKTATGIKGGVPGNFRVGAQGDTFAFASPWLVLNCFHERAPMSAARQRGPDGQLLEVTATNGFQHVANPSGSNPGLSLATRMYPRCRDRSTPAGAGRHSPIANRQSPIEKVETKIVPASSSIAWSRTRSAAVAFRADVFPVTPTVACRGGPQAGRDAKQSVRRKLSRCAAALSVAYTPPRLVCTRWKPRDIDNPVVRRGMARGPRVRGRPQVR